MADHRLIATVTDLRLIDLPIFSKPTTGNVGCAVPSSSVSEKAVSRADPEPDLDVAGRRQPVQYNADQNAYTTNYFLSTANLTAIGDFVTDGHFTNADMQGLLSLLASGGGNADGRAGTKLLCCSWRWRLQPDSHQSQCRGVPTGFASVAALRRAQLRCL